MVSRAIFLDRDGVINRDNGYTYKITDLEFLPDVPESLRILSQAGFKLFVITNQSGVARGFYTLSDVNQFHDFLQSELARYHVQIDAFLVCPHHPQGVIKEFAKACDCRKPEPGLIREAMSKFDINLSESYLIGDKFSDIECAKRMGIKAYQVLSEESKNHPWAVKQVTGLGEVARLILG